MTMICPRCGERTGVWRTRVANDGRVVVRVRVCSDCGARYVTQERVTRQVKDTRPSKTCLADEVKYYQTSTTAPPPLLVQ